MKSIFLFFITMVFWSNAFCNPQDSIVKTKRYHINYPVVGSIIGIGMISDAFAISRIKGKAPMSKEELDFLNTDEQRNLIDPIDRWALRQKASDRDLYKKISDYGQVGIYLLPGLLLLDKDIRKNWGDLLLMYTEGHTITFTFYNYSFLGPTFHNRYRPMAYYSEFSDNDRGNGNNRNSLYSGHVASCTYSTFFMTKVYCDYHPDLGPAKYLLYVAASIPPLFMGYSRVKALDHFPSDDAIGFLLGATIGIVIPELHKKALNRNLSLGLFTAPGASGLSIHLKLSKQHIFASGN